MVEFLDFCDFGAKGSTPARYVVTTRLLSSSPVGWHSQLRPSPLDHRLLSSSLLQESNAPVEAKLCVAGNHELLERDLPVLASHYSPEQILDHDGILVLPIKVVGMQVYHLVT